MSYPCREFRVARATPLVYRSGFPTPLTNGQLPTTSPERPSTTHSLSFYGIALLFLLHRVCGAIFRNFGAGTCLFGKPKPSQQRSCQRIFLERFFGSCCRTQSNHLEQVFHCQVVAL